MKQYLRLMRRVLKQGRRHSNRTGTDTLRISGAHLQFDLRNGFPATTTKRLAFKQVVGELLGFLRGYDSAAQFRRLGCTIWDANANENKDWLANPARQGPDHLGRIYGVQWRRWGERDSPGPYIDQVGKALESIIADPDSRRILVTAWNPNQLPYMALPPCHVLWQVMPDKKSGGLDLCVYIRSWDLFLGGPFNIASYALLTHLLAMAVGYKARTLNVFAADVHLYVNHLEQVKLQLSRKPRPLPKLVVKLPHPDAFPLDWLTRKLRPDHILLADYDPYPAIPAPMAV